MENKEFDMKVNNDMHNRMLELNKKTSDVAGATLKLVGKFIELLSNLSPTSLPKIAVEIAKMANPVVEAQMKLVEIKLEQAKMMKDLPKLEKQVKLPELDKVNPIKDKIDPPDLNMNVDNKKVKLPSTNLSGLPEVTMHS